MNQREVTGKGRIAGTVAFLGMTMLIGAAGAGSSAPTRWSWQETHAKVLPTGALEWAPRPFIFERGQSVRYIDFEAGDDARDGTTLRTAWKHHPWDANATGKAALLGSNRPGIAGRARGERSQRERLNRAAPALIANPRRSPPCLKKILARPRRATH